jgi:hypothetical protein
MRFAAPAITSVCRLVCAGRLKLDCAILAGGRSHGRGVREARAGRGERGPRGRRTTPATTFPSIRFDFKVLIRLLAGDGQAHARRVRGLQRRGGRGRRQAARRADAPHVLQDAHGIGHQHARRVLRAAPRRRGLLPASGACVCIGFSKMFSLAGSCLELVC